MRKLWLFLFTFFFSFLCFRQEVFAARSEPLIVDHRHTDITKIPVSYINTAKNQFNVLYGHTSHGKQITRGLCCFNRSPYNVDFYYYRYVAPSDTGLSLGEGIGSDLGNPDRVTWATTTREWLNRSGSNWNVVMWSWCGQVSTATETDINTYLSLMNQLENDYPNVTFIYMTGHVDGTGESGNLHQRNEQIRRYCRNNNKVLFDFADVESYDPDGNYYLNKKVDDACYYDSDGNGSRDRNWALDWYASHAGSDLCKNDCGECPNFANECPHSKPLNCNLKASAFWWMMARVAGWNGGGSSPSPTSTPTRISTPTPTRTPTPRPPTSTPTPTRISTPTLTRTPTPTSRLSPTPYFSPTSQPTQASCPRKSQGDANCDGKIDGVDYSMWLNSQCRRTPTQSCASTKADFNGDGNVDDSDYSIWFGKRGT